ncbi:MAG: RIP metalloprotease RseP [Proteobacteria bacterium]|nr:RIP metalloprotease RseP [Burkholderiales bacterium]
MTTVVAFVVALAVLIVVHELGHYLVARACGVKVLRFSVGFGTPLFKRVFGPDRTEWVVGAIPLGGYVKMVDEREGNVDAADLPRAFNRQSVWRRIAIVAAGPIANFLLAITLYWALFIYGIPGMRPIVATPPPESIAARAGFQQGDTITAVDGETIVQWQDARWRLLKRAVDRAEVRIDVVEAGGRAAVRNLDLSSVTSEQLQENFLTHVGLAIAQPKFEPVIGRVVAGSVAERAGLLAGDRVLSIDGGRLEDWEALVRTIRASPGRQLVVEIDRDGRAIPTLRLIPDSAQEGGLAVGKVGIGPKVDPERVQQMMVDVRFGPIESLGEAIAKTWSTSVLSLQMLGKMLVGEVSIKNLSGPITIADYAGQSVQVSWVAYLTFIALISISLGVLNLLPIPMLDGGHLLYYSIEVVRRRPVSERVMAIGQQVGMGVLLVLMAFAIFNDIHRLLGG